MQLPGNEERERGRKCHEHDKLDDFGRRFSFTSIVGEHPAVIDIEKQRVRDDRRDEQCQRNVKHEHLVEQREHQIRSPERHITGNLQLDELDAGFFEICSSFC